MGQHLISRGQTQPPSFTRAHSGANSPAAWRLPCQQAPPTRGHCPSARPQPCLGCAFTEGETTPPALLEKSTVSWHRHCALPRARRDQGAREKSCWKSGLLLCPLQQGKGQGGNKVTCRTGNHLPWGPGGPAGSTAPPAQLLLCCGQQCAARGCRGSQAGCTLQWFCSTGTTGRLSQPGKEQSQLHLSLLLQPHQE